MQNTAERIELNRIEIPGNWKQLSGRSSWWFIFPFTIVNLKLRFNKSLTVEWSSATLSGILKGVVNKPGKVEKKDWLECHIKLPIKLSFEFHCTDHGSCLRTQLFYADCDGSRSINKSVEGRRTLSYFSASWHSAFIIVFEFDFGIKGEWLRSTLKAKTTDEKHGSRLMEC